MIKAGRVMRAGPSGSVLEPRLPAVLDAEQRGRVLDGLGSTRYDVIVIGGGVTGAGVALDAVTRGLRTLLVERVDLAAGPSRWSSKLIHGGLRYLARGDLAVAWESAVERHTLLTAVAPHLVRAVPTLVPLDDRTLPTAGAITEAGLALADAMRRAAGTPSSVLPPPRRVSATEALVLAPGLRREGLRGGLVYWDGALEDDARLVIGLARTAAAYGADFVTRCAASELREDSVRLTDQLTGASTIVRGLVVNATGVWAGEHEPSVEIAARRGSHLVVRAAALDYPRAVVTAAVPGHFGRFVFVVPQADGLVLVGLTDEPSPGADGIAPPVPDADVDFLLATLNAGLARPISEADVVGRFAGLRPLVIPRQGGGEDGSGAGGRDVGRHREGETADVSRQHLLVDLPGRPLSILGGKLTTYRRMAQDTVDAACRRLGLGPQAPVCRTRSVPLVGAAAAEVLRHVPAEERLVRRYGTEAPRVAELAERHGQWLADPVVPESVGSTGSAVTGAELLHGVLAEGALCAEDLIERRARLTFVDAHREAALAVADRILLLADRVQSQRRAPRRAPAARSA